MKMIMFPTKGDLKRLQRQIDYLVDQVNTLQKEFWTMSDATGAQIAHIRGDVEQMAQDAAQVASDVDGIKDDLVSIQAQIDLLKSTTGGQLSPENQAALDALTASADAAMTSADSALSGANGIKATADAMVTSPPPPPPPPPNP